MKVNKYALMKSLIDTYANMYEEELRDINRRLQDIEKDYSDPAYMQFSTKKDAYERAIRILNLIKYEKE